MPAALKVLSTTAMKTSLDALGSQFERASGHKLDCAYAPSARITRRIADGETADAAIVTAEAIEQLGRQGRIVAGSRRAIASSQLALAVRSGAPRPNISTVEGFKGALLAARAIALSNPVGGGQSGAHMQQVLERLGIAAALQPKISYGQGGPEGLIGLFLVRGEADIGVQQMPELMAVPGIDIVGPLPPELQAVTRFAVGTMTGARDAAGADALGQFLCTPAAASVMKAKGLEPAH
jgi:molybdate transport system substrate-binding protein